MLERSLLELVGGQCFSSTGLANTLLAYLRGENAGNRQVDLLASLHIDCREALLQSMEQDRPRQFRRDDLRRLFDTLIGKTLFVSGQLPLLEKLSNSLLVRHGDYLHYRDTQVQTYARLAVDLDPTLLAAWHFSGWMNELRAPGADAIRRVLDHQTQLFAPLPNSALPHAEGHVHLGGVSAAGLILGGQLLGGLQTSKKERKVLLRLRRVLGELMDWSPATDSGASTESREWQDRLYQACRDEPDLSGKRDSLPDWDLLVKHHAKSMAGSPEWLLAEVARRAKELGGLEHSWLWLLVFLLRRYRQPDTPSILRVAILYLLTETMQLRRMLIMDNLGLSRFTQDYFPNNLRKTITSRQARLPNLRHLMASSSDLLEAKGGPNFFNPKDIADLARQLGQTLGQPLPPRLQLTTPAASPNAAELGYLRALEQWQFCAHFSRKAEGGKDGQRHAPDMSKLWKSAEDLQLSLQRTAEWNRPEFLGGRLNPYFRFEPSRWLRGLDVAGNENDLRIEWFAPQLRWLRLGLQPLSLDAQVRSGFHLSIHAGEDYAHPLSGLRHIDETVRFCEMRDGDRLGHALALGIKPKHWAAKHGDMVLPVDEHLDNLVWAWHHASLLSPRLPLAGQVLPLLERRIRRMQCYGAWLHHPELNTRPQATETSTDSPQAGTTNAREKLRFWVSQLDERITPELLFQAWRLRRNCHYQLSKIGRNPILGAKEQCAVPDLMRLQQATVHDDDWTPEVLYRLRHRQLALGNSSPFLVVVRVQHSDHCHTELNHAPEETDEALLHDSDSPEELCFMHALQDYLLHEYDRKGLIIEANPTSNVYIARVGKHSEHPIFRWSPPDESTLVSGGRHNRYGLRSGPIRVLVNTDDPGIMPTTLRTEYALLREAAIELGIARTVAEDWLERLRRYGVEQFHRHHQQIFTLETAGELFT
jgi:hypothetical protein